MGYQALLFCADEKLARVVSQLFSELDFTVSPVTEPFAAVQNLMAQHYDAVVIDCENEQSASLLIKSARNSSFNQGSLTIALVEGQVGVAKAYRMGANLVLPKPVNVEQAKGTLRVARGLLRKGAEAASHAAPAAQTKPAAAPTVPPVAAPTQHPEPIGTAAAHTGNPRNESHNVPAPAAGAAAAPMFAKSQETPGSGSAGQAKPWAVLSGQAPFVQPQSAPAPTPAPQPPTKPQATEQPVLKAEPPAPPVVVPITSAASRAQGSAAAAAPAKEISAPPKSKKAETETEEFPADVPFRTSQAGYSSDSEITLPAPSFGAIDDQTSDSGGSKKILIGAVAVIVVVIAAYFGYSKFGTSQPAARQAVLATPGAATVPAAATQQAPGGTAPSEPPAPAPAPTQSTSTSHATTNILAPSRPSASAQPAHSAGETTASTPVISLSTETKPTAPAPIMVKRGALPKGQSQEPSQTEEAAVQPPSALGMASPSTGSLSGVLSAPAARPSLAVVRLSQGVSQGLLIKQVQPKYPPQALATHTQGAVEIEATIDKQGRVVNPRVLSGSPMLANAALEAVRQWRYKPYFLDGEPVEIQTQITIRFKAQ